MANVKEAHGLHEFYLGIDVGSVSTNLVVLTGAGEVYHKEYLRTKGRPIPAVQAGLAAIQRELPDIRIKGVGATGSGRRLAAAVAGADIVKNEITATQRQLSASVPMSNSHRDRGQDSKIIILREGIVTDFAMNTVCAAGTGSFLDQQAARLGIPSPILARSHSRQRIRCDRRPLHSLCRV